MADQPGLQSDISLGSDKIPYSQDKIENNFIMTNLRDIIRSYSESVLEDLQDELSKIGFGKASINF